MFLGLHMGWVEEHLEGSGISELISRAYNSMSVTLVFLSSGCPLPEVPCQSQVT